MGVQRAIRGLLAVATVLGATAPAAHASLSVPTGGSPTTTFTSLAGFEAAIGGGDNGTAAGEQAGGFRHITWDGLAVDGSDPGSAVIEPRHVAAVSPSQLQPWGIALGPEIAVANDGFSSANPAVDFTPFSRPNVWAPFNSNTAELDVIAPSAGGSSPVPAQTRGLGVELLGDTSAGTSIEYYNGEIPLLDQAVPAGATFAGALFPNPVVTRVVITLGTAPIFDFDGSTVTPTSSATDFVAGDDVVLAEPAPARPVVAATAGVPVTAALDAFTESNPNATVTATIDWGDATRTVGTITAGPSGTLIASGDHAYSQTGIFTAQVTVNDASGPEQSTQTVIQVAPRGTATSVTCSPATVAVSAATECSVVVTDTAAGSPSAPTGLVTFNSPTAGAGFPGAGSCLLGATALPGTSLCMVQFEPTQLPPGQARVIATYDGDDAHGTSDAATVVAVHAQRCSLSALSRRLRPSGFGVLVTCDARATVLLAAQARATRKGPFGAFAIDFGSAHSLVTPGRPTVLVIKPASAVLRRVRAALARHQHVSLKLTLTATSHSTRTTTTKRVSAIRVS